MIRTRLFTVAALGALTISGCSGGADVPTQSTTPTTHSATPSAAPSTTPTPTPPATPAATGTAAAAGLPSECEGTEGTQDTEGDPIAGAAATAELPEGVVLMGTQVITSIEEDGMFEGVARTCSAPLSEDDMYEVANAIAIAIYEEPAGETVASLRVTSWVPNDAGSITEGTKVRSEDFQIYLWDTQISAGGNWELAGRDY